MKQLIISFLIFSAAITGIFFTAPQDSKADCQHYFVVELRGDIRYLVEYSCDGSMVNITVLED